MSLVASLDLERRVDRLIEGWDRPGSPGVTVAVIREGAFLLRRHAGRASIELGVPIGDGTAFRVASVTKQFTCTAILLLAAEGRLDPADDIRRHLPELPDMGARITLDHLMRNTSGIRDMFELLRLGGLDLHQPCAPSDLLDAIRRQRGLNFAPGTRFLYSNSNFLLLGRVVERLSGMSLAAFMEERIFRPLGMSRTRLVERTDEVVPGLATGYLARPEAPGGIVQARHGYPLGGEGGLVSTVEDLALWERNFSTARVGGPDIAAALEAPAPFTNGTPNAYARGLEHRRYRGLATIGHGGLWPGFKTLFLRVPERRLAVICIANFDAVDAHALGYSVLDAVLADDSAMEPPGRLPPEAVLRTACGRYLDRESGTTLELALGGDGQPRATMYGASFPLLPDAGGRLHAHRGAFPLGLTIAPDGDAIDAELDAGATARFDRIVEDAPLPADIAGLYESVELAARWRIEPAGASAALAIDGPVARGRAWRVTGIAGDVLRIAADPSWIRAAFDARILRDDSGKIAGLRVNGGRVKDMTLRRVG
jgi:CubicO group peptidase (beta-lactamase class C family)